MSAGEKQKQSDKKYVCIVKRLSGAKRLQTCVLIIAEKNNIK